jgi:ACR3 family arsenite transporter
MVVAFAPIVGLLLGLSAITVPWDTLVSRSPSTSSCRSSSRRSCAAGCWRGGGPGAGWLARKAAADLAGGAAGDAGPALRLPGRTDHRPAAVIGLLAVPILIQVYFNSGLAYLLNRMTGEQHCVAGPSALIGASNFFELAVAAAISLFGFQSGAALATVVGVLIEVPVMLSVVWIVNRSKGWYEAAPAVSRTTATERH